VAFGSVRSLQSGAIAPAAYSSSRFMSVSAILHAAAARDAARDAAACCQAWDGAPRGGRTRDNTSLSRAGRGGDLRERAAECARSGSFPALSDFTSGANSRTTSTVSSGPSGPPLRSVTGRMVPESDTSIACVPRGQPVRAAAGRGAGRGGACLGGP